MGGNDVGNFDDKLKRKLQQKMQADARPTKRNRHMINFDEDADMEREFEDIKEDIDDVFDRLHKHFRYSRILFISIWARPGWNITSIRLADQINQYIEDKWAHKVMDMHRYIKPHHFLRDDVHLTQEG